ncbi:MAG: hypothetical protein GXW99_12000 [Clostridiales bacterium]|nr:hypothetical protein [Clostridiales bacterium]
MPELKKACSMSLLAINGIGTSKSQHQLEFNAYLRECASRQGATAAELRQIPYAPSPLIHSYGTMTLYIYYAQKFGCWVEENHPDAEHVKYARRYAHEYIQSLIDRGLAPSTVASARSALAKLYRTSADDIYADIPVRHTYNFTRSRNYDEIAYKCDTLKTRKCGKIAMLCRATGVRETELEHLYPECFQRNLDGSLYLHLDGSRQHPKNGKSRDIIILPQNQEFVRTFLEECAPGEKICPHAPEHLDIHGIRSLYARDYYSYIARPIQKIPQSERIPLKHPKFDAKRPNQVRDTAPAVYTRLSDGQKFDRRALLIVSKSLGHNREDVVVNSYLW